MVILVLGRTLVFWIGITALILLLAAAWGMCRQKKGRKKYKWPIWIAKLGGVVGVVHFSLILATILGLPV